MITSVAFQDHITRSLLHPNFSLSDPLARCERKAPRNPQARRRVEEKRGLRGQDRQEDGEYVLDSAPPPLTLGKTNTLGNLVTLFM